MNAVINRSTGRMEMGEYPPMRLVARESSKRLVSVGYIRLLKPGNREERTVRGSDFIELDKSIVYEGLDDLLY